MEMLSCLNDIIQNQRKKVHYANNNVYIISIIKNK